jgi:hypothetical protein
MSSRDGCVLLGDPFGLVCRTREASLHEVCLVATRSDSRPLEADCHRTLTGSELFTRSWP